MDPQAEPVVGLSQQVVKPQEIEEEALVLSVKQGAALIKWIPWPWNPEKHWVPLRTCTLPELDAAYLLAVQKCVDLGHANDPVIFSRYEKLGILSAALRNGFAVQEDLLGTMRIVRAKFEEPLFTSAEALRSGIRDDRMLDELWNLYQEHSRTAAPLSTAKRAFHEARYLHVLEILKKKHGPIGWDEFSPDELAPLIAFLLNRLESLEAPSPA